MIILDSNEDDLEKRFGPGAKVVNTIFDNRPSAGYVDENGNFRPLGSDDRKRWEAFKEGCRRKELNGEGKDLVSHYLNLGVQESFIKGHISRLAKQGLSTDQCWIEFEKIYQEKKLDIAAAKGKEEALMKFSMENPEVKVNEESLSKDPTMLNKLMSIFKVNSDKVKVADAYRDTFINLNQDIEHNSIGRTQKLVKMSLGKSAESDRSFGYVNSESNQLMELKYDKKIKLSGGLMFEESDVKSCIQGKLQLHSQKRAIKLTKRQIKELEEQLK